MINIVQDQAEKVSLSHSDAFVGLLESDLIKDSEELLYGVDLL